MYKRGMTKEEMAKEQQAKEQQKKERMENIAKNAMTGHKKWVRYDEGAALYSMGLHSFQKLAKDAKAVYRVNRIVLINTEKIDEFIELMCSEYVDE